MVAHLLQRQPERHFLRAVLLILQSIHYPGFVEFGTLVDRTPGKYKTVVHKKANSMLSNWLEWNRQRLLAEAVLTRTFASLIETITRCRKCDRGLPGTPIVQSAIVPGNAHKHARVVSSESAIGQLYR